MSSLTSTAVRRYLPDQLIGWATRILEKAGLPRTEAYIIADHLVEASLRGVDSHGISRMPIYVKRIEMGLTARETRLTVEREAAAFALVDGGNGSGPVVAVRAMEMAIEKAMATGIGVVGVKHSNHCGCLAYYTTMAASARMIGFAATSAPANMPPWGGRKPYFGTNPFSLAVPAGEESPIIFDMATSVVARGKIILAAKEGKSSIPPGWAIDAEGRPTTDPVAALDGSVLPVGGPKGYGLALLVDVLSGIMPGALFGPYIGDLYREFDRKQGLGHFFMAMRADLFVPMDEFLGRMDQMIREIRSQPRAEGVERIYIPGEIEAGVARQRRAEGIPLADGVVAELAELGNHLGVALPT